MDPVKTGKIICEARKKIGMTQKDLASKLFVSNNAVSKWERGINMPDISLLPKISEILEVSLLELLGGDSEIRKENFEVILKDTIGKVSKTDKLLKILKLIIFVLIVILIIISILFASKLYNKNKYLFNVSPDNVDLDKIGLNYNLATPLDYENNYTKKDHINKLIGLDEGIYSKLPLYNYKDFSLIIPNDDDILYSIGIVSGDKVYGYSEDDINKVYKDKYYTKKSMFVISVVLFNKIYNLETVTFHFTNQYYQVNKNDLKQLFDFETSILKCSEDDCNSGEILNIKDYDTQVRNKLNDNRFLNEFINDKKIDFN